MTLATRSDSLVEEIIPDLLLSAMTFENCYMIAATIFLIAFLSLGSKIQVSAT